VTARAASWWAGQHADQNRTPVRYHHRGNRVHNPPATRGQPPLARWTIAPGAWTDGPWAWTDGGPLNHHI